MFYIAPTVTIINISAKKKKKKLCVKQVTKGLTDLIERLGSLKAEVLGLYRLVFIDQSNQNLPSGPSKRTVEERLLFCSASVSIPKLQMLNILSEQAPKKTGFSVVMQSKSLITMLGLSRRSHNYGTSYYAN